MRACVCAFRDHTIHNPKKKESARVRGCVGVAHTWFWHSRSPSSTTRYTPSHVRRGTRPEVAVVDPLVDAVLVADVVTEPMRELV